MTGSKKNIVEFTLFYNKHKVKLFNYVIRMVPDRMTGEDIVQTVFLKLFENMNVIKNKSSMIYWLFKTARNEIYGYYRKKKIRVDQFNALDTDEIDIEYDDDFQLQVEKKEMKEILMSVLETLPTEQKEVFYLKEYGGLSYKEIASMMEIDENLVKSRLFKTKQKLIRIIGTKIKSDNY